MQNAVNASPIKIVADSQRAALVSLLVDEDPAVYQIVRTKILSFGPTACDWLRPHVLSSDPILRKRCQEIINYLARGKGDDRFLDFCLHHGEELDLEEAAFLLAQTKYPDVNLEAYRALLDAWACDLLDQLDLNQSALQILGVINRYFFEVLSFAGNPYYGDSPESCYLNRVVDRRTGNPISLCALYMFIARRLRLPVSGIGLPGYFICRYQCAKGEIYVNVFQNGKFWSKADCIKYLLKTNHGLHEGYLAPMTPRRMLLRMCSNLHQTYSQLEMTEEVTRVQRYLVALAK